MINIEIMKGNVYELDFLGHAVGIYQLVNPRNKRCIISKGVTILRKYVVNGLHIKETLILMMMKILLCYFRSWQAIMP